MAVPSDLTPYSAFSLLWDSKVVDHLLADTARYCEEKSFDFVLDKSRLELYLAVILAMRLCPQPEFSLYWSEDDSQGIPNALWLHALHLRGGQNR